MTTVSLAPHLDFAGSERTGGSRTLPISLRTKLLSFTLSSYVALIVLLALVREPAAPLAAWVWPPLWWLIDLLLGGPSQAAVGRQVIRIPLLTSVIVVAALSALSVFSPVPVMADDFLAMLIGGLLVLTIVTTVGRWSLFVARPRRRLRIMTEREPAWQNAAQHAKDRQTGTRTLLVASTVFTDPEALTAAIVQAADYHEVETVEFETMPGSEALRSISWQLRLREVTVDLPLCSMGIDPHRLQSYGTVRNCGISVLPARPGTRNRIGKRLLDASVSAILLIALLPLFLIVAAVITLTMPGPILFRQERIGKDGKPFYIIKFRSMVVNADAQLQELLKAQGRDDVPLFKVEQDPRITPVGSFLRRSSIDELPQLLNVLHGTMSLVGPRPQRAGEVELYTGVDSQRLGVLPGMTGLWQVSGRSDLSWEEAREYDLYYAHNWNLRNDIAILARTFRAVVQAAGAS